MSFLGSMVDGMMLSKAKAAVQAAEVARRERAKTALSKILGNAPPDQDVDVILAATRQAEAVRGIAGVVGKNMIGEILSKIADALEGR